MKTCHIPPALLIFAALLVSCGDNDQALPEKAPQNAMPASKQKDAGAGKQPLAQPDNQEKDILSGYETQQVAPHTYVIHGPLEMPNKANQGFMNNPAFIVTDQSVIVIDPGSSVQVGRALVARIKEVTDKPVTHVFDTHVHGDHWLGNHGITEAYPDAQLYAHPKMIEKAHAGAADEWVELMLSLTDKATAGTKAVIPTRALENGAAIKVDNITIKAHIADGKAHTETDAMYEVVEDKVLFTGDNITYKRIPRMNDGSFPGNIAVADSALALPVEIVVPGHGPTGDKSILKAYRQYLSIVYEGAKRLTEEGLEDFEMKPRILAELEAFRDWSGLEEEVGRHISLAVIEAEAEDF